MVYCFPDIRNLPSFSVRHLYSTVFTHLSPRDFTFTSIAVLATLTSCWFTVTLLFALDYWQVPLSDSPRYFHYPKFDNTQYSPIPISTWYFPLPKIWQYSILTDTHLYLVFTKSHFLPSPYIVKVIFSHVSSFLPPKRFYQNYQPATLSDYEWGWLKLVYFLFIFCLWSDKPTMKAILIRSNFQVPLIRPPADHMLSYLDIL